VRRGLRAEGVIVDLAASGKEAVWVAAERHYGAVVPGIDGFETCARLRREEVWAPVLMLTARDSVECREPKSATNTRADVCSRSLRSSCCSGCR
jgi:two-component system OmpR family response regulator